MVTGDSLRPGLALSLEHDPAHNRLLQPFSTSAPSTEGALPTSLVSVRAAGALSCFVSRTRLTSCRTSWSLDLLKAAKLFTDSDMTNSDWGSNEKYFHRCFARFRQFNRGK